ncbi:MAG: DNA polymerase III subunit beta [Acholeplasmatales bacterium]|nr:DNA polymerase III subunit beta [Acholeplasmatales bacterium]
MNITIDREILLENLNVISRGLPNKSPMPILTGIKMEATDTDLFLTSSNTDISVEVLINDVSLKITEPGKTVVPGKQFIDIIRIIGAKKVNLLLDENNSLIIKGDKSEFNLKIMDYMDYPNIDFVTLENPLTLESSELKSIIRETVFSTAQTEKKPILTGVNFNNKDNQLVITATDSFRLSQKILSIDSYQDFNITIPNKSLDEMSKVLDSYEGKISLYFSSNKLLLKYKNVLFQTRLLDGNYPDTSRIMPTNFPIIIRFNRDELLAVVERVSIMSPKDREKDRETTSNVIKLTIKKDRSIEISTTNNILGSATEEITPTDIEATNAISIGFSSRYFIEALRSFMSTEISISLSGEIRPFIVRGDYDANLTQLILPLRMD